MMTAIRIKILIERVVNPIINTYSGITLCEIVLSPLIVSLHIVPLCQTQIIIHFHNFNYFLINLHIFIMLLKTIYLCVHVAMIIKYNWALTLVLVLSWIILWRLKSLWIYYQKVWGFYILLLPVVLMRNVFLVY